LLFADDTALAAEGDDIDSLAQFVNEEFRKVCNYFRLHGLSLHPDKTRFMVVSSAKTNPNVSIFINNNNMSQNDPSNIFKLTQVLSSDPVPAIKYLGVFFDPHLNFKFHINHISKKISQALFTLKTVKNFLPPQALKTLYFSLIHCHFIYAAEIWGCATDSVINDLFKKQKKAIRIICNEKYNAHTENLFKKLEILKLPDLIKICKLKLVYQILHCQAPSLLHNTWHSNRQRRNLAMGAQEEDVARPELRNEDDLHEALAKSEATAKLPFFSFPKIWNQLSLDCKSSRSCSIFFNKLKLLSINTYSNVPTCTRLFCPACTFRI
jgi:hypothetical protein